MGEAPRAPRPPEGDEGRDLLDETIEDADWANRIEPGFSARRVEVRRGRLTGAQLPEGSLIDVMFADCRADLASFRFSKLTRVAFRDCRLEECDFYGAELTDVLFERCDLRLAVLSVAKCERVELRGCKLEGAQGVESLRSARLPWSDVLENAPLFAHALGYEIIDD